MGLWDATDMATPMNSSCSEYSPYVNTLTKNRNALKGFLYSVTKKYESKSDNSFRRITIPIEANEIEGKREEMKSFSAWTQIFIMSYNPSHFCAHSEYLRLLAVKEHKKKINFICVNSVGIDLMAASNVTSNAHCKNSLDITKNRKQKMSA